VIRHIVMWKFKDSAEGATRAENLATFKTMLEGCRDLVPGTLHLEVGIAGEGLESSSDIVLISDFTDKAALDAYQVHPEHLVVKDFAKRVVESRQAVDYEV
jgi:quinol monooxygenase YgiN